LKLNGATFSAFCVEFVVDSGSAKAGYVFCFASPSPSFSFVLEGGLFAQFLQFCAFLFQD